MGDEKFQNLMEELASLNPVSGLTMSDLIEFPEGVRLLLTWMIHEKVIQVDQVAAHLAIKPHHSRDLLDRMASKGLIEEYKTDDCGDQYQVTVKSGRNYRVPKKIWDVFED